MSAETLRCSELSRRRHELGFSNATCLQDVSLVKCRQKLRWPASMSVSTPVSWPRHGDERGEGHRTRSWFKFKIFLKSPVGHFQKSTTSHDVVSGSHHLPITLTHSQGLVRVDRYALIVKRFLPTGQEVEVISTIIQFHQPHPFTCEGSVSTTVITDLQFDIKWMF